MILENFDKFIGDKTKPLARIGLFSLILALVCIIFVLPVTLGAWTYQVDPLSLVATTIIGYFAYIISIKTGNQELIALEAFRPKIEIPSNGFIPAENKLTIQNRGDFEADDLTAFKIYYSKNDSTVKYTKELLTSTLTTEDFHNYTILRHEYISLILLYRNRSTGKTYIKAVNFHTEKQSLYFVGANFDDSHVSPLASAEYLEILKLISLTRQIQKPHENPYLMVENYLENLFLKNS